MNQFTKGIFLFACIGLSSCTEPGETTGMGAAAGGVIGAGLGAIVGSATGNAGTGLVLGAAAGSVAGGAMGNVVEGQHETIRTQDEAIERHEKMIAAQRQELIELRRMDSDNSIGAAVARSDMRASMSQNNQNNLNRTSATREVRSPRPEFPGTQRASSAVTSASRAANLAGLESMREENIVPSGGGTELQKDFQATHRAASNLAQPALTEANRLHESAKVASEASMERVAQANNSGLLGALNPSASGSNKNAECVQAAGEVRKAQGSQELADRLFHLRRALRLCPDEPSYHNGLGEVYSALNRRADAEFEFREALKLNPEFAPAQDNLNALR